MLIDPDMTSSNPSDSLINDGKVARRQQMFETFAWKLTEKLTEH